MVYRVILVQATPEKARVTESCELADERFIFGRCVICEAIEMSTVARRKVSPIEPNMYTARGGAGFARQYRPKGRIKMRWQEKIVLETNKMVLDRVPRARTHYKHTHFIEPQMSTVNCPSQIERYHSSNRRSITNDRQILAAGESGAPLHAGKSEKNTHRALCHCLAECSFYATAAARYCMVCEVPRFDIAAIVLSFRWSLH